MLYIIANLKIEVEKIKRFKIILVSLALTFYSSFAFATDKNLKEEVKQQEIKKNDSYYKFVDDVAKDSIKQYKERKEQKIKKIDSFDEFVNDDFDKDSIKQDEEIEEQEIKKNDSFDEFTDRDLIKNLIAKDLVKQNEKIEEQKIKKIILNYCKNYFSKCSAKKTLECLSELTQQIFDAIKNQFKLNYHSKKLF